MTNALSFPFPTLPFHHFILTSSKALKMALIRTIDCFKKSHKERLFLYQNTEFIFRLSKLCHIHRLKQFQIGLHRGYKKKFIFNEGIEEFGSYMENEHSFKNLTS
jgi:hypothetical protein